MLMIYYTNESTRKKVKKIAVIFRRCWEDICGVSEYEYDRRWVGRDREWTNSLCAELSMCFLVNVTLFFTIYALFSRV